MTASLASHPFVLTWAVGFTVFVALVLWSNHDRALEDQFPPAVVLVLAIWPIAVGLMLLALVICFVGMLADHLSDPRDPT